MQNNLLLMLLIAHFLGDFYLQSSRLAEKKENGYPALLLHCFLYFLCGVLIIMSVWNSRFFGILCLFGLWHFIIDSIKFACTKYWSNSNTLKKKAYIIDQIAHIIIIILITSKYAYYGDHMRFLVDMGSISTNHLILNRFLRLSLLLLVIFKPANITFERLFSGLKPSKSPGLQSNEVSAGPCIGNMERLLMVILFMLNQYIAIGLVLTGKSIARYKMISEEKEFAQYYLIGTLYSILSALIPYCLIYGF